MRSYPVRKKNEKNEKDAKKKRHHYPVVIPYFLYNRDHSTAWKKDTFTERTDKATARGSEEKPVYRTITILIQRPKRQQHSGGKNNGTEKAGPTTSLRAYKHKSKYLSV